jgi:hypothetical protein
VGSSSIHGGKYRSERGMLGRIVAAAFEMALPAPKNTESPLIGQAGRLHMQPGDIFPRTPFLSDKAIAEDDSHAPIGKKPVGSNSYETQRPLLLNLVEIV